MDLTPVEKQLVRGHPGRSTQDDQGEVAPPRQADLQQRLAMPPALATRLRVRPGRGVDLARLAGESWLMPGPETSCHELTRRACGAAGFVPRPVGVASDFSVLLALVAAGAGVTVVPRMALPDGTPGVSLHPLRQPITRTVSALTTAGAARQPHLRRVLDCLRAAAGAAADPDAATDPDAAVIGAA